VCGVCRVPCVRCAMRVSANLVEDDVADSALGKELPVFDPLLQARVQPLVVHVQQLDICRARRACRVVSCRVR
jgi:hypothetical protein